MAAQYTRFTPRCEYGCVGYVTFLMGPRGGVHGVWSCIECGRMPTYKPAGYIPLTLPRKRSRPNANEDSPAA